MDAESRRCASRTQRPLAHFYIGHDADTLAYLKEFLFPSERSRLGCTFRLHHQPKHGRDDVERAKPAEHCIPASGVCE